MLLNKIKRWQSTQQIGITFRVAFKKWSSTTHGCSEKDKDIFALSFMLSSIFNQDNFN